MKFFIGIIGLLAIITIGQSNDNTGERVHYNGYKVFHVTFETEEQFNALLALKNNSLDVMFWQLSHGEHYADIMVGPKYIEKFLQILSKYDLKYEVTIEDAEEASNYENSIVQNIAVTYSDAPYVGYKLYHVTFQTDQQYLYLKHVRNTPNVEVYFWEISNVKKDADILMDPIKSSMLLDFFNQVGIKYEIIIEDASNPQKSDKGLEKYDHYKIYHIEFTTEEQFKFLDLMFLTYDGDFSVLELNGVSKNAKILVSPTKSKSLIDILNKNKFAHKVYHRIVSENKHHGSYAGFKVYEVKFTTEPQYSILVNLMYNGSTDLSFWNLSHDHRFAHILVGPEKVIELTDLLKKHKMTFKIIIDDVGKHIKKEV